MYDEYPDPLHSDEGNAFKINGQDVILMSLKIAKIFIHVPWPMTNAPTAEQKEEVMTHAQKVVKYLVYEGMLSSLDGLSIMVYTQHS